MKLRLDFVTNSSSSSFLIECTEPDTLDDVLDLIISSISRYNFPKKIEERLAEVIREVNLDGKTFGDTYIMAEDILKDMPKEHRQDLEYFVDAMDSALIARIMFRDNPDKKYIIVNEMDSILNLHDGE